MNLTFFPSNFSPASVLRAGLDVGYIKPNVLHIPLTVDNPTHCAAESGRGASAFAGFSNVHHRMVGNIICPGFTIVHFPVSETAVS